MNSIFVLINCYYDSYVPEYFIGPENVTQEEFIQLCQSLLGEAFKNSYLNRDNTNYIGNNEVIKHLITLLQSYGYTHFSPKIYEFFGPSIYNNSKNFNEIKKYVDSKLIENVISYNKELL